MRRRAWEPLGFARLGDYGVERVGLSARSLQDLARVDGRLSTLPMLERALFSGALPWTKVRLLARVAEPQDEPLWVTHALRVSADELSREVRAVDVGSVEAGAADADPDDDTTEQRRSVQVRCAPRVNAMWFRARQLARRMAGEQLPTWACMELVAAEVLSAVPLHPAESLEGSEPSEEGGAGGAAARSSRACPVDATSRPEGAARAVAPETMERGWAALAAADPCAVHGFGERGPIPRQLQLLLDGLGDVGPHELDARLRRVVALEQRLDAEIGRLLAVVSARQLHRLAGSPTLERYARARLGISPRKVRALLRLERAGARSAALRRAYRSGELSWVCAQLLVPLVLALEDEPGGSGTSAAWVAWAQRVSVRRLRDDVERAWLVLETDPAGWHATGGLPEEAGPPTRPPRGADRRSRQIRARSTASHETSRIFFTAPSDVARLFEAVLRTVQRRLERSARLVRAPTHSPGRSPTRGDALEAMLVHCLDTWAQGAPEARRRHRVFERDGWRCTAPACSSLRSLHDHHIVFRSAGGSDDPSNRTTLCAWHHLRGVHAGLLHCSGRAPAGLRFDLGVRAGQPALASFASGDVLVHPLRATSSGGTPQPYGEPDSNRRHRCWARSLAFRPLGDAAP